MSSTDETHDSDLPAETENPLLWTCTVCATSVNIFARSEHLLSRSHRVRLNSQKSKQEEKWRCEICEVTVAKAEKDEHLIGWGHMLNVRTQEREEGEEGEGEGWDETGYVGKGAKRRTFYCITCRSEFLLHEQEEHVSGLACHTVDERMGDEGFDEGEADAEEEDEEEEDGSEAEVDAREASDAGAEEGEELVDGKQGQEKDVGAPPPPPPPPPPAPHPAPSGATFTCPTCSYRSFPLSEQSTHGRRIWKCQTCNLTMHRSQKAEHKKLPDHTWHCDLCNKTVSRGGRGAHENSETHQARMGTKVPEVSTAVAGATAKEMTGKPPEPQQPLGALFCYACNSYIPLAERSQHGSPIWCCEICRTLTHLDWKNAHMLERHGVQRPFSAQAPSGTNPSVAAPGASASTSTKFHCLPCRRTMPLVDKPTHLSSAVHWSNLTSTSIPVSKPAVLTRPTTLNAPTPPLVPTATTRSESHWKCAECRITMSVNNMASHIGGKKHQEVVRLAQQKDTRRYCGFCKAPVVGGMEVHLASEMHKTAMRGAIPGFTAQNSKPAATGRRPPPPPPPNATYYCDTCDRNVFVAQRDKHLSGIIHTQALRMARISAEWKPERLVEKREEVSIPVPVIVNPPPAAGSNKFYCEACGVFKTIVGREGHMKSKKHKKKVVEWEQQQAVKTAKARVGAEGGGKAGGAGVKEMAHRPERIAAQILPQQPGTSREVRIGGTAPRPQLLLKLSGKRDKPDEFADMYYCDLCDKYMNMDRREMHLVDLYHLARITAQAPPF